MDGKLYDIYRLIRSLSDRIVVLENRMQRLEEAAEENLMFEHLQHDHRDCPVCFVPWGACDHTNPPR